MSTLTSVQPKREPSTPVRFRAAFSESASSLSPGVAAAPLWEERAPSSPVGSDPRGSGECSGELAGWLTMLRRAASIEAAPRWAETEDAFGAIQAHGAQSGSSEDGASQQSTTITSRELDPLQHNVPRTTAGATAPHEEALAGEDDDSWWREAQAIPAFRIDLAAIAEDDEHWPLPYGRHETLHELEASVIAEARRRSAPDWVKRIREMLDE